MLNARASRLSIVARTSPCPGGPRSTAKLAACPSGPRMRFAAPACARHKHAPCAPSRSAATGRLWAALAFARSPADQPPPSHRAASTLRPAGSRLPATSWPARHPLSYRLACKIRGAEGADSDRRPPLRPARGLFSLVSPHAPGASGLAGVREGEGEGEGRRGKGEAPASGTKRDPLRSWSNNQFIIEAPTERATRSRSNQPSSSPQRPRARSRSCRLSTPSSRHDAKRTNATVSVVAASTATATEVAVASASRAT